MNLRALCHRCGATVPESAARHVLCDRCAADPAVLRKRLARRAGAHRGRAIRAGLPAGLLTAGDVRRLHREQRGRCALCRGRLGGVFASPPGYHIDHRAALANGGENVPDNIQLLCVTCNLKKGAR